MSSIHIRMDDKLSKTISENCEKYAIKRSRYIHSLLEKGLVLEHQLASGRAKNTSEKDSENLIKLAEILVENIMLTRKLIRQSVKTQEEHREILEFAVQKAKEYVEKYFLEGSSPEK